ncbi:MAG: alginate export family protein [Nevskiales bacterium]|nr:alginate export family protein [Nevskiales bacterium]
MKLYLPSRRGSRRLVAAVLALSSLGVSLAAPAAPAGQAALNLRLRYETVDQDNTLDAAEALTLRTRLGYRSPSWRHLSGFVEFESVAALTDDYAPETAGASVVADPTGSEVNQFGLSATRSGWRATIGRQRLILDNARWVGNVGWRQNEQTFDGLFLRYAGAPAWSFDSAYLSRVQTIKGDTVELRGWLNHLRWQPHPALSFVAYADDLDFDAAGATDLLTTGLRASGTADFGPGLRLGWTGEYARQSARTAAADHSASYRLIELSAVLRPLTLRLGGERLGSDAGAFSVQTPLATKHAFQGWADVFLNTPADGVNDRYLAADAKFGAVKLGATYHVFEAARSRAAGNDYGSEIDVCIGAPLMRGLAGLIKAARYDADGFGVDTDKVWLQLEYQL